ncbi:sensor histidine kinase [Paenibacillus wynnii]|uniref:sensor histidine kinase n=1 Tax=Paenibacillus wynnii TaxID=268407 RepID=UPI00278F1701|nr:sensor histidine kinase [Paenibacillus wynnii]MDQ0193941.1 signal transduction histidine kinase [Paenibacillus wynnii]
MRLTVKNILHIAIVLFLVFMTSGSLYASADNAYPTTEITEWQMKWGNDRGPSGWMDAGSLQSTPEMPNGVSSAWIRIPLPEMKWSSPSIYIDTLYALHVKVYVEDHLIFEGKRNYIKDNYSLLFPLSTEDSGKTLYIWTETLQDRIGIKDTVIIGEHDHLIHDYTKNGLIDIILGSAFIFVALILFFCAFFLSKDHFTISSGLAVVIASTGILSITYSPFIYTFYSYLGPISIMFLDFALLSLLPSLTFLFEKIFGPGKFFIIRRFRKFQVLYSIFCLCCMTVNILSGNQYVEFYYFVSTKIIGFIMIIQFILLIACVTIFSFRRNKDALIFAFGFGTAALTGVLELVWYYVRDGNYDLSYWKWALVIFIISLIVILGRRLALDHAQVVKYSRELELFNNELQRSEKVQIISELAASVAHEVRNPLQVTRGFLQLLSEKSSGDEKEYMSMALSELDRASNIITDFLTFAKPEFEQISILNVCDEFRHIESILLPLCHLNNGKMVLDVDSNIWIKGNSSKFKQALINIIKNSIEAFQDEGTIHISAYRKGDKVLIHVKDNGEGMNSDVLLRLGEPYFSQKNKGTGLGLMVTFRIIEVMQGEVVFRSKKGAGTEVVITLPMAAS